MKISTDLHLSTEREVALSWGQHASETWAGMLTYDQSRVGAFLDMHRQPLPDARWLRREEGRRTEGVAVERCSTIKSGPVPLVPHSPPTPTPTPRIWLCASATVE